MQAKAQNIPLLGRITHDWMMEYSSNWMSQDTAISFQYGRREFDSEMEYDSALDALAGFQALVSAYLIQWQYELKTLYATTQFDYDPIVNYDNNETSTDVRTPNLTHKTVGSSTQGQQVNTSSNKTDVAPYNGVNYVPRDNATSNETMGSRVDSGETTLTESGMETYTHTLHKTGNIGTMTTQQMVREERGVANFNFLEHVYQKLMNTLTINIWR